MRHDWERERDFGDFVVAPFLQLYKYIFVIYFVYWLKKKGYDFQYFAKMFKLSMVFISCFYLLQSAE